MQGCNCFQALDNDMTVGKETSETGSTISWLSDWRYLPDCCVRRTNESRAWQNHELSRVLRRWGGWGRLNVWTKGVIPKWNSQNLHRNPFEPLAGDRASHAQDEIPWGQTKKNWTTISSYKTEKFWFQWANVKSPCFEHPGHSAENAEGPHPRGRDKLVKTQSKC